MTSPQSPDPKVIIAHPGEDKSNALRRRLHVAEPFALRTFTPSLAVLAKSAGSYHWTPEGRKLADFTSGVLVHNLGYNPVRWWHRVLKYLGLDQLPAEGDFFPAVALNAYNSVTEIEIDASERLLKFLKNQKGGGRFEQVMWAASGSEAIQKALWAALDRRPGENVILATRRGFHGKKGLAGAVTGTEQDAERDPRVRFISFPQDECSNVAKSRRKIDLAPYEKELESLRAELGNRMCALITEPYLGGGGSLHPQVEYIQLLERFCRKHDLIFIFDEVQANFGRTGEIFAFTRYGVEPDIVVLGKGLGNGVPVSAAVGRRDLFDNMHFGEASDTWSANPLSSAAVLATLDEFESTDVMQAARELSRVIEQGLLKLTQLKLVANIRGEGVVWGIECAPCGKLTAEQVAIACVEAAYRGNAQGEAIHLLGPLAGKVIRVSPPLVMPPAEAKHYLEVLYDIFAELQKKLAG